MAGGESENSYYKGNDEIMMETEPLQVAPSQNELLCFDVLHRLAERGVTEFCICPGGRNSLFVSALENQPNVSTYYWFEERSAAFFALGRMKATGCPVAVMTTSGTAAGELLPAAMEAYYCGLPLILVTADRPRRFRGSGAPQTAEQVDLYGKYVELSIDLAEGDVLEMDRWDGKRPLHINVCFEEPLKGGASHSIFLDPTQYALPSLKYDFSEAEKSLSLFLDQAKYPLVIVSTIPFEAKEEVAQFLKRLGAPVFLEGVSGLREHSLLRDLRIQRTHGIWTTAEKNQYPIDGILRIGGVPTVRLWRDLEDKKNAINVCSISDRPFSGLSWGSINVVDLKSFFCCYSLSKEKFYPSKRWLQQEESYKHQLQVLFHEEPLAEQTLIHQLSVKIPKEARIYLGNSLPIREWDAFATTESRGYECYASRGLNGIDGQVSTFLGLCSSNRSNWGIFGDMTMLYDMAAPWILSQLSDISMTIVIINNFGGKIFERMFPSRRMLNCHSLSFQGLASLWNLHYLHSCSLEESLESSRHLLLEITPDDGATKRFWKRLEAL